MGTKGALDNSLLEHPIGIDGAYSVSNFSSSSRSIRYVHVHCDFMM